MDGWISVIPKTMSIICISELNLSLVANMWCLISWQHQQLKGPSSWALDMWWEISIQNLTEMFLCRISLWWRAFSCPSKVHPHFSLFFVLICWHTCCCWKESMTLQRVSVASQMFYSKSRSTFEVHFVFCSLLLINIIKAQNATCAENTFICCFSIRINTKCIVEIWNSLS